MFTEVAVSITRHFCDSNYLEKSFFYPAKYDMSEAPQSDHPGTTIRVRRRAPRRSKDWLWTSFHVDHAGEIEARLRLVATYFVYQRETAPTTGRQHLQGFVQFPSRLTLNEVQQVFEDPQLHLEVRRGTVREAIAYCTKAETRTSEGTAWGNPNYQGRRTDLAEFRDAVKRGAPETELLDEFPDVIAKHPRFSYDVRRIVSTERASTIQRSGRRVYLLVGGPGTGKSSFVWDHYGTELWTFPVGGSKGSSFFDGYYGQRVAFFDEFYGQVPFTLLNQITDRYPVNVQVKGGFTAWVPEIVFIASTRPPEIWYPQIYDRAPEVYQAVMRRIRAVVTFPIPLFYPLFELL